MMERHNARVLGINGVADHVHLLVKVSSTTSLCNVVKDAKGVSSRFANERMPTFKWRPTYAAFSVSRWDIPRIRDYIARQKEHHARGTIKPQLESDE
jgi:putative transposase